MKRNKDGRFILHIPLKGNIKELGDSRQMAERRVLNLERKFQNNEAFKEKYVIHERV